MQNASKELLAELLTIIQYANDKEAFIAEFEGMNYLQATTNLIDQLPLHLKVMAKVKFNDPQWVKEHISEEALLEEVEKVRREELALFIQKVSPTLNASQKEKIKQLFFA